MSQKGLAPIIIVTLVTLVLGGFIVYQKQAPITPEPSTTQSTPPPSSHIQTDETGKFKVYTDPRYSFKFPADWVNQDNDIYPPGEQGKLFPTLIQVFIQPRYSRNEEKASALNQQEFDKQYLAPVSKTGEGLSYKSTNLTVAGQKAIRKVEKSEFYKLDTWFRYGIDDYHIIFDGDKKLIDTNMGIYNQLVDSFQLTGPPPSPRPITIKTYQDKHGYSFQHPSNWLINSSQGDYRNGITVVDEDDQPVLILLKESPHRGYCPLYYFPEPQEVELGNKKVMFTFNCDFPQVRTASGQVFKVDKLVLSDPRIKDLLKSTRGLSIVQPSLLFDLQANIQNWSKEQIFKLIYYLKTQIFKLPAPPLNQATCTQEAKLCPDGSSVGRAGPNCEFAPCPTPKEASSSAETCQYEKVWCKKAPCEPVLRCSDQNTIVLAAKEDLAKQLNTDINSIKSGEVNEVEWSDAGLGCPKDGMIYAQVITPGYKIIFEYNDREYEYHTDKRTNFVRCEDGKAAN